MRETLQDPDTGTSIAKLSHRPKDNTDYFYFPQERPLADADTVVMCAPLSTKPLLPNSAFESRDEGDPVYHHCYFRIRYQGPVMIDADFWDIQWNEVADVRHALIDLVDRLVVK